MNTVSTPTAMGDRILCCRNFKYIMFGIPSMMALSSIQSLQKYMRDALHTPPHVFQIAYGFVYIGSAVFRIFHNIIFSFCKPFWRLVISISCMVVSLSLQIVIQNVTWSESGSGVWILFLAYFLGGMSVGVYGANILNVTSLAGRGPRYFMAIGLPIGLNSVTIFSFVMIGPLQSVLGLNCTITIILAVVILLLLASMVMLFILVPHGPFVERRSHNDGNEMTTDVRYMAKALRNAREWFWQVLPNGVAQMGLLFCSTTFNPGILFYIIGESSQLRLFGLRIKGSYFISVVSCTDLIFAVLGRTIIEYVPYIFPLIYSFANLAACFTAISGIPELIVLGGALTAFTGGCIYQQTARYVREVTDGTQWNLISYSLFLFMGDCANIVASNTQQSILGSICGRFRSVALTVNWDPCRYEGSVAESRLTRFTSN